MVGSAVATIVESSAASSIASSSPLKTISTWRCVRATGGAAAVSAGMLGDAGTVRVPCGFAAPSASSVLRPPPHTPPAPREQFARKWGIC